MSRRTSQRFTSQEFISGIEDGDVIATGAKGDECVVELQGGSDSHGGCHKYIHRETIDC